MEMTGNEHLMWHEKDSLSLSWILVPGRDRKRVREEREREKWRKRLPVHKVDGRFKYRPSSWSNKM